MNFAYRAGQYAITNILEYKMAAWIIDAVVEEGILEYLAPNLSAVNNKEKGEISIIEHTRIR